MIKKCAVKSVESPQRKERVGLKGYTMPNETLKLKWEKRQKKKRKIWRDISKKPWALRLL